MPVTFTKVSLLNGWLGNMASFPVRYRGREWRTSEALFQAMRFVDENIRDEIHAQKSPMAAKFIAKKYADRMVVDPGSGEDLRNMELCLRLKIEQNPSLAELLLATGKELIIEDVTARQGGRNLFWGMANRDGVWIGENCLGKIWMKIREELRDERAGSRSV
jgi:predicted NAD-dependent protein-ADP-ribosyltransferase YbiA (DUF1768 family)